MPFKQDDAGRRWVEMEFVVPGTPDQVWQAVATGPGNSAWFTPTTIDEHVGGTIAFDFGAGVTTSGPVTAWEPPVRFAYDEVGWSGEAPPLATEITVTSRSGDQCVVRVVHSLVTDRDDWDGELESFEGGWPTFFDILRIYLADHAGEPAAVVNVTASPTATEAQVWKALVEALGFRDADLGDVVSLGTPRILGTVEQLQQNRRFRQLLLRITEPTPGALVAGTCTMGGQTMVNVSAYLYGPEAAQFAGDDKPAWAAWLAEVCDHAAAPNPT
jgi:uncharacterized protein YndB with AHSA1/START domain